MYLIRFFYHSHNKNRGAGRGGGGRGRGGGGRGRGSGSGRGTNSGHGRDPGTNSGRGRGRDPDLPPGVVRYTAEDGAVMLTEDTSPPVQENEEEDNGNRDVEDDGDSVISCSDQHYADGGELEETDEESEEQLLSNKNTRAHWRGLRWDAELNQFELEDEDDAPTPVDPDGWKKKSPRDMKRVKVSFDKGRESMIGVMRAEYAALDQRLEHLIGAEKTPDGLMKHFFGESSYFSQAMMKNLDISHDQLVQFIATFYAAAQWGQPAKRLQDDERFVYEGFMDQKELNDIWKKIGRAGKDGAGDTYLWEDVEAALNRSCRELFLTKPSEAPAMKMYIALDDDKVRFQYSSKSVREDKNYLCGMKGCQHVKSNCKGMTIDSAVSSVTGFPLNVSVLRQGHKNNTENYERMVRFMFHQRFHVATVLLGTALDGITFCSDRGYWNAPLILLLIGFGATVFGTLKRMEWVPYTFDQKLSEQDKRVKIEKKYGRSVFLAFARWGIEMLKVLGWRSGTGAVSLAMRSGCGEGDHQEFDFCFANNGDAAWYKSNNISQDERNLHAFHSRMVGGESEMSKNVDSYLKSMAEFDVKMLNCIDHGMDWFVLRMFSFTSSSTEAALRNAAPFIPTDNNVHSSFQDVFEYAGLAKHLSSAPQSSAGSETDGSLPEDTLPIGGALVKTIIASMRQATQRTVNKCARDAERIKMALDNNEVTPSTLEAMLIELGMSRERAAGDKLTDLDKKKVVLKWIKSITAKSAEEADSDADSSNDDSSNADFVPYKFPYDILIAAEVTSLLLKRVGSYAVGARQVPGPNQNPTKRKERVETLHWLDAHPDILNSTGTEQDGEDNNLRDAILSGAVSRAFLRPLEKGEKVAAKLGHQNEPCYLKQYFKDSNNGRVPGVKLCEVVRCGLAMKQDKPYIRSSVDAIAFEERDPMDMEVDDDDDARAFEKMKMHLVECKCKSGAGHGGSLRKATRIQEKVADLLGGTAHRDISEGHAVYMKVSSQAQELNDLIPDSSERIQLLHHAYTYGHNSVTYLVGNPTGNILFGLIVTFEKELLESYGEALDFLYENGLNLFYSNDIAELPLDVIENILLSSATLKSKFQIDDFMMSLLIWRELLPGGQGGHKFPIPKCDMLLPFEHSLWNSCKGGSDTVTRFAWNCLSVLPIRMPQTSIMARFFLIYAVVFHRVRQVMTMRKEVDVATDTIQTVRDRNNKRYAFHQSLNFIHKSLLRMLEAKKRKSAPTNTDDDGPSFTQKDAPRYNANNAKKRFKVDHSLIGRVGVTGATPFDKGKSKASVLHHPNYQEYNERIENCTGFPVRFYNEVDDGGFKAGSRNCEMCASRAVSWMCIGCKQVLCFDKDRSEEVLARLKDDKAGTMLKQRFPALANLSRGDVPAYYTEMGVINGKKIIGGMSCFHLAHPRQYCLPCNNDDEKDPDSQLSTVAASSSARSSPSLHV